MRLIEAIGFYSFALTVGGVWLSLGIEGWIERHRKPKGPIDWEAECWL